MNNSQHSIQLIQAYYSAFNQADWPTMLALLDDDVVHDLNQGEREIGRKQFSVFLQRMQRCYLERLTQIQIMATADGKRAAAEYVVNGLYLSTDRGLPEAQQQSYVLSGGAFFEIADTKITRVSNYYNLQKWLQQISEQKS